MATPTQATAEREQNRTPRKSPNVEEKENENAVGENSIHSKEVGTPSSILKRSSMQGTPKETPARRRRRRQSAGRRVSFADNIAAVQEFEREANAESPVGASQLDSASLPSPVRKRTLAEITNDQSTQDDAEDAFPQQTDLKLQRVHHGNQRGSRRHSFPSHETALTECQQHTPSHQRRQSVGTLAHHDVAAEEEEAREPTSEVPNFQQLLQDAEADNAGVDYEHKDGVDDESCEQQVQRPPTTDVPNFSQLVEEDIAGEEKVDPSQMSRIQRLGLLNLSEEDMDLTNTVNFDFEKGQWSQRQFDESGETAPKAHTEPEECPASEGRPAPEKVVRMQELVKEAKDDFREEMRQNAEHDGHDEGNDAPHTPSSVGANVFEDSPASAKEASRQLEGDVIHEVAHGNGSNEAKGESYAPPANWVVAQRDTITGQEEKSASFGLDADIGEARASHAEAVRPIDKRESSIGLEQGETGNMDVTNVGRENLGESTYNFVYGKSGATGNLMGQRPSLANDFRKESLSPGVARQSAIEEELRKGARPSIAEIPAHSPGGYQEESAGNNKDVHQFQSTPRRASVLPVHETFETLPEEHEERNDEEFAEEDEDVNVEGEVARANTSRETAEGTTESNRMNSSDGCDEERWQQGDAVRKEVEAHEENVLHGDEEVPHSHADMQTEVKETGSDEPEEGQPSKQSDIDFGVAVEDGVSSEPASGRPEGYTGCLRELEGGPTEQCEGQQEDNDAPDPEEDTNELMAVEPLSDERPREAFRQPRHTEEDNHGSVVSRDGQFVEGQSNMDNAQSQIHVGEAPLMERVPQESQMEKDVFQPEEGEANESFEEARNHNRAPPANDAQSEMTSAPSPAPPARRQSAITEALQKRMQDMNSANKGGRTPQEKPAKEEPMPSVSLREFMDAAEVKFMSDGSLLQRRSSVNQYEAEMPKLETDEDKITFLALTAEETAAEDEAVSTLREGQEQAKTRLKQVREQLETRPTERVRALLEGKEGSGRIKSGLKALKAKCKGQAREALNRSRYELQADYTERLIAWRNELNRLAKALEGGKTTANSIDDAAQRYQSQLEAEADRQARFTKRRNDLEALLKEARGREARARARAKALRNRLRASKESNQTRPSPLGVLMAASGVVSLPDASGCTVSLHHGFSVHVRQSLDVRITPPTPDDACHLYPPAVRMASMLFGLPLELPAPRSSSMAAAFQPASMIAGRAADLAEEASMCIRSGLLSSVCANPEEESSTLRFVSHSIGAVVTVHLVPPFRDGQNRQMPTSMQFGALPLDSVSVEVPHDQLKRDEISRSVMEAVRRVEKGHSRLVRLCRAVREALASYQES